MKFNIGNYTIEKADGFNITVSLTRPNKKSIKNPEPEGDTTVVLGFYGSLEWALLKVRNHSIESSDAADVSSVLMQIRISTKEIVDKLEEIGYVK